jgi:hypothetical protein
MAKAKKKKTTSKTSKGGSKKKAPKPKQKFGAVPKLPTQDPMITGAVDASNEAAEVGVDQEYRD